MATQPTGGRCSGGASRPRHAATGDSLRNGAALRSSPQPPPARQETSGTPACRPPGSSSSLNPEPPQRAYDRGLPPHRPQTGPPFVVRKISPLVSPDDILAIRLVEASRTTARRQRGPPRSPWGFPRIWRFRARTPVRRTGGSDASGCISPGRGRGGLVGSGHEI